jgi:ribA/ribD-fused uncharacterized protein
MSAMAAARTEQRTPWKRRHPRVWNRRDPDTPSTAVYIGRGRGPYGNPYSHLPGVSAEWVAASRDEAVDAFDIWARNRIRTDPVYRRDVAALHNRDVVCWCAPNRCHGEVLVALAGEIVGGLFDATEDIDVRRTRARLIAWIDRTGRTPDFFGFFRSTSPLSQWAPTPFKVDGIVYATAEHWMMASKAALFDDDARFAEILASSDPAKAKRLGRLVADFDEDRWAAHRRAIVHTGSLAKFTQNPDAGEALLATGTAILVEASPYDWLWGAGIAADDPRLTRPDRWPGQNLLGFVLMDVRDEIRART